MKISQEELADRASLHRTYVSQLERGLKSPSLRAIEALAVALGITPSLLVKAAEREADLLARDVDDPKGPRHTR